MKALELELKNIGPFASSKLDFTRLEPMFLVTGKTGSGKTTIFDAMTYALYGNCTGSRKNNSSGIKSDFSNSEDEAYVIFTFLLNDSTYRVYRSVQYEYINRNGKKSTKACEVSLEIKKEDGWHKYEANKSETDKKIISLIGLSEEEFSKIVVLPQGEFAKFLHENSNTKSQTLAKLFPVDLYTKTMNSLKEKANTAKEEISFKEKQLAENLSNFETQKTTETIKKTEEKLKTFIENKEKFKNEKDKYASFDEKLLTKSLFQIIYENLENAYKEGRIKYKRTIRIDEQHRMHPTIGTFISNAFYDGGIQNGEKTINHINDYNVFNKKNVVWLNVPIYSGLENGSGQSYEREAEAQRIVKLVEELVKKNPNRKLDLGIISYYKGQVELIRAKLKEAFPDNLFTNKIDEMCNTVDSYQGKEFDIVIISGVRSNNYATPIKSLGFIQNSPSRINVSLSRAKKLLIMVADADTYKKNEYFQKFLFYVKKEGFYE